MQSKGVKHVLSLLGDDEATEYYTFPLDEAMEKHFGGGYTRTSVFLESSRETMSTAIRNAKERGESIVIHCSGGEGRAALGMGLWLVDSYGLAPEDAAREVAEQCEQSEGIVRKVSAAKLKHLVTKGSMVGFSK